MLRVRLVGELRLDVDGRPLPAIPSRRARSLLGWLALHPGLHPRSRVAAVFWPDVLEHSSRGSLRTTLATLRRALGPHADVLVGGRADVGLDGAASVDTRELVMTVWRVPELVCSCSTACALPVWRARRIGQAVVAQGRGPLGEPGGPQGLSTSPQNWPIASAVSTPNNRAACGVRERMLRS